MSNDTLVARAPDGPIFRSVVRVVTQAYETSRGVHVRKSILYLKRLSDGPNVLKDDVDAIGAEDAISAVLNLHEVPDGVYELRVCDVSREYETGYVDDWSYKLIPFDLLKAREGK
jgi:hypothetical protein